MLKLLISLYQRKGWSLAALIVVASYIARGSALGLTGAMRSLSFNHVPNPLRLPWSYEGPILIASLVIADYFLRAWSALRDKRVLDRKDLPWKMGALAMWWPRRVQKNVWEPAYEDLKTIYSEQRESFPRLLNTIFLWRVACLVLLTFLTVALHPSLLLPGKSRSSGES